MRSNAGRSNDFGQGSPGTAAAKLENVPSVPARRLSPPATRDWGGSDSNQEVDGDRGFHLCGSKT